MKLTKIVLLAMIFAFTSAGIALAGSQIQVNQITDISASVENTTGATVDAAVKLIGYDDAGVAVAHVCQETTLAANDTTVVNFAWKAPAYATGIYWSSSVTVSGTCANHDADDSDSDSDGDSVDSDSDE